MKHRSNRLAVYGIRLVNSTRGGVLSPLMPLFIYEISHRSFTLSSISSNAGVIVTVILSPLAGVLVDRLGRRKLLIAASGVASVVTGYLISMVEDYRQYILVSLAGSAAGLAGGLALSSLIADSFDRERRGRMLGFYGLLGTAGSLLGNLMSAYAYRTLGLRGAIRAVSVAGLLPVAVALLLIEDRGERASRSKGSLNPFSHLSDSELLRVFAVNSLMRTPQLMCGALYAVYFVEELGGSMEQWALLTALTTAAAFTYVPYGYLVDRLGRLKVLYIAAAGWAVLYTGYAVSRDPATFAAFYIIPIGNAYSLAITSMLYDATDGKERGKLLGSYSSLNSLYTLVAATLGGLLADVAGPRIVFTISAVLYAASIPLLGKLAPRNAGRARYI